MENSQTDLDQVVTCDVCQQGRDASEYCKDCDEYYCETCLKGHSKQKATKSHNVIEIDQFSARLCEPCVCDNVSEKAINRCLVCSEYLCENCTKAHRSQKQNKDHTIRQLPTPLLCEPCKSSGEKRNAESFCLDCDDPEPMCFECTKQHKRMKKTKGHNMCTNKTKMIIKFNKNIDEVIESGLHPIANVNSGPKCHPCSNKGIDNMASHVCVSCSSEYFCQECIRKHKVSKRSCNHEISEISHHETTLCESCTFNKLEMVAIYKCEDCNEYMCANCGKTHNSQKATRNHKLIEVDQTKVDSYICDICKQLGSEVTAVAFCKDCDEPELLCQSCAEDHRSLNETKNHNLSTHLQSYELTMKQIVKQGEHAMAKGDSLSNTNKLSTMKPSTIPSKPSGCGDTCHSDHVDLCWSYEPQLDQNEHFIIMFKVYPDGSWNRFLSQNRCQYTYFQVSGLKADTSYVFTVKVVNDKTGKEGQLSEESEVIKTVESPARHIIKQSEIVSKPEESPAIYRLPLQEITSARNSSAMTRKFILGSPKSTTKEKTILVVGATGSGKSTLINGMANYIMGVTWEDPFRFTLIRLEPCEEERIGNEALSQTEWITCYTICKDVASRLDYTINLIDTPGFGDTRGIEQDAKIISQIRELFMEKGDKGVSSIDAVCFILKAPDARLTATQKYIFESILALFGNDIKDNICTLVTFADGQKPPVLAGLEALDGKPLPYETYFAFNNSAIFVDNTMESKSSLSPVFWELGMKSCKEFFVGLLSLQTKSLLLTSEVLANRQKLENTILHLQEEIDLGLSKVNVLEQQIEIFTKYKTEIRSNENFTFTVEESKMEKVDISGQGIHTTTCLICNFTCHNGCALANDNQKRNCCAMDSSGNCTACPKKCIWRQHSNVPYVFKWFTQRVDKTYSEMRDKYQQASKKKMSQEQVLHEMSEEIKLLEVGIQFKVEEITDFTNTLKEIALRPDPLSTTQYIELLIESEKREKKKGFNGRIETLEQCKKRSEIDKTVNVFASRLQATYETLDNETTNEPDDPKKKKSVIKKFTNLLFGP